MTTYQVVNALANLITSMALLAGAIPLLIKAIRELAQLRYEVDGVRKILDRRSRDNDL